MEKRLIIGIVLIVIVVFLFNSILNSALPRGDGIITGRKADPPSNPPVYVHPCDPVDGNGCIPGGGGACNDWDIERCVGNGVCAWCNADEEWCCLYPLHDVAIS